MARLLKQTAKSNNTTPHSPIKFKSEEQATFSGPDVIPEFTEEAIIIDVSAELKDEVRPCDPDDSRTFAAEPVLKTKQSGTDLAVVSAEGKKDSDIITPGAYSEIARKEDKPMRGSLIPGNDTNGTENYKKMEESLVKLFDLYNRELFDYEIRPPIISIQSSKAGPTITSWCTTHRVWKVDGDEVPQYQEISFLAAGMKRPLNDIITDLLHQMIHMHNAQNEIKDSSRGGTYHNAFFKHAAEEHGIACSAPKGGNKGYTNLTVPPDILAMARTVVDESDFAIRRENPPPEEKKTKKKQMTPLDDFFNMLKDTMKTRFEDVKNASSVDVAMKAAAICNNIMMNNAEGLKKYSEPSHLIDLEHVSESGSEASAEDIILSSDPEIVTYDDLKATGLSGEDEESSSKASKRDPDAICLFSCKHCGATLLGNHSLSIICGKCKVPFEIENLVNERPVYEDDDLDVDDEQHGSEAS